MPIYTDTLPQSTTPIITVSIRDLIKVLPDKLPWEINVWLSGKLARYGITTDTIIFLTDGDEPTVEQRQFFEKLISPLGPATINNQWKNETYQALRIYDRGQLIIDKNTLSVTKLVTPTAPPILKVEEVISKLPKEIPFEFDICLTGSLVKDGWSANDADFIAYLNFDEDPQLCVKLEDRTELRQMAKYFTEILGWKTHIGNAVMEEREPVYLYQVYHQGQWLN
jgi:hypothetical protein